MKLKHTAILSIFRKQVQSYTRQLVSLKSSLNQDNVYIAIDSEWASLCKWIRGFANWLQSAALLTYWKDGAWRWRLFVFTSASVSINQREAIEQAFSVFARITFVVQDLPEHASIIEAWLEEQNISPDRIELVGKYSPLDYHAFFGNEVWLSEIVDGGLVSQKRCLRFELANSRKGKRVYKPSTLQNYYCLRDLQGLNTGSLKKQGEAVGVSLFAKDLPGYYLRGRMREAYAVIPCETTLYNICDTFAAMQIALAYIPLVNEIIDSLGLPASERITLDTLSHTTGSLVGRVFCSFIEFYPLIVQRHENLELTDADLDELVLKWRLILWRNSRKNDRLNPRESRVADSILQAQQECKTLDDYRKRKRKIDVGYGKKPDMRPLADVVLDSRLMQKLFVGSLYQQACAKVIGSNVESTSVFAALVQGGRCNNSNPFSTWVKRVLDVDMSSCYGSTLRKLLYPIGLPSIYSRSFVHGEKQETFFDVFNRLRHDLVDDLWFADVFTSSHLTFSQDLVFSSFGLTPDSIRKAVTGVAHYEDEEGFSVEEHGDVKKIPSEFALTRKQIQNGRICASSNRVLNQVATDREKGELKKKLVCNALVYYPHSTRFTRLESFVEHMMTDSGSVTTDAKNNVIDNRSRAWFPIKLEYFIGVLVDSRKKLKKEMNKAKENKDTNQATALNAKQEMFKLFVNTLYGDLASVYFSFGNVVLANVITDKARVGAWMMSKALRTRMEITDGGFYSPFEVAFNLGKKLPGLDVLSDWRKWELIRRKDDIERVTGCLGWYISEDEWERFFQEYNYRVANELTTKHLDDLVDSLADEHIRNFWQAYGLEFEFGIEHKYEHTSWCAGYLGKSDYCLKTVGNIPDVIKKRGARMPNPDVPMSERDDTYNSSIDPGFDLLRALAEGDTSNYQHKGFRSSAIVKVGEYQEAKALKDKVENPKTLAELKTNEEVVPGWEIVSEREPRQLNNGHIYLATYDDYDSINKRKPYDHGQRQQFFERYIQDVQKFTDAVANNELSVAQVARNKSRTKTKAY